MSRTIELPSRHQDQTSADFSLEIQTHAVQGVKVLFERFRIGVEEIEVLNTGKASHRLRVRVPETSNIPAEVRLTRVMEVLQETHGSREIARHRLETVA